MTNKHQLTTSEIQVEMQRLNAHQAVEWEYYNNCLNKEFSFESFREAFSFMSRCAEIVENLDHHPEWCNAYNTVSVQLTTHEAGGVTSLDFKLAGAMDAVAKIC